jgi:hypothetical protein
MFLGIVEGRINIVGIDASGSCDRESEDDERVIQQANEVIQKLVSSLKSQDLTRKRFFFVCSVCGICYLDAKQQTKA